MIAVLDYGGGNVGSLLAALARCGAQAALTGDPQVLASASAAILPGDGAFGATMDALRERGLVEPVQRHIKQGKPFLGICVGMQILFERSTEFGGAQGLGFFSGAVSRFEHAPRVPHMGWNSLDEVGGHPLVLRLGEEPYAYFLHSYRAPVTSDTVATSTHGERFSAIVARGSVMGTQFHPEKSQAAGARLLENFLLLTREA